MQLRTTHGLVRRRSIYPPGGPSPARVTAEPACAQRDRFSVASRRLLCVVPRRAALSPSPPRPALRVNSVALPPPDAGASP